jgi:two-component system, NarL family, sensor histidine kinase UhpB
MRSGPVVSDARQRPRTPAAVGSVFWRVFLANGVVFTAAAMILALSPATVSTPISPGELAVLCGGLIVMLAVDAVVVRAILRPLDGLGEVMARVDLLVPGARADERGSADVVVLIRSFNAMLDRLEAERNEAGARRLADQEAERGRISRELPDEVGQSLTAVLLGLRRLVDRAPGGLQAELVDLQEVTRSALEEIREVARRLRPPVLDDLGLVSALADLATDFTRRTGRPVEVDLDSSLPGLDAATELAVYRIAQESLTNTARHAGAGPATVSLTAEAAGVVLRVRDEGGDSLPELERGGIGLRGMRERAVLVGADLSIGPAADGGTEVRLTLPLTGSTP